MKSSLIRALNSYVTREGLETGRAQIYQAETCGILPDVRMNPILLNPSADDGPQVILLGKAQGKRSALNYGRHYEEHLRIVREPYDALAHECELRSRRRTAQPKASVVEKHNSQT